jgi:hypothetical protein
MLVPLLMISPGVPGNRLRRSHSPDPPQMTLPLPGQQADLFFGKFPAPSIKAGPQPTARTGTLRKAGTTPS